MFKRILTACAVSALVLLAACDSPEEKAEAFYQSGLELLAAGDPDRAAVEFRNVFNYNEEHQDARRQLAEIMRAQGNVSAAFGQYLRLAEQYPDLADARLALAQMAIEGQQWDEAERHGRRALELDPTAEGTDPVRVSLDFRQASIDEDEQALGKLALEARALADADPDDILSRRVLIAYALTQNTPAAAIDDIDAAIAYAPDDLSYYIIKIQALNALGEQEEIGELLRQMYTQFPENTEVQQSLITFYIQRQDYDGAEAFLRDLAGDDTSDPAGFVPIIQLLERTAGRDAARAELKRLAEVNAEVTENNGFYRALLAGYDFDEGNRDAAIAEMQAIIEASEPSDQTRRIKGTLATMLLATGNQVGARALAEEILTEDETNVTALKLRAQMLISADQPGDAILDLRRALDQSPRDTSIILLLAAAHERNGSTQLQGERLATAVEVSGSGVRESLLYADFLVRQGRDSAARSVLADARNAHPRDLDILAQTARLAMADNAIGVVRGVIADVEKLQDQPRAPELLKSLRTALLLSEDRLDEGLALLQQQAEEAGTANAVFAVLQTQLRAGKLDEARTYLDSQMEEAPDDPDLRLMNAALLLSEGDAGASEVELRKLVDESPTNINAVNQLYVLLRRTGQPDAAKEVLTKALADNPESPRLLLYEAGDLEQAGDVEGAIAIYEKLYAVNTGNVTIANNLASLLSTFRDDEETLERAAAVARRLRDTDIPPFQDTYGWIAYRQGNFDEALTYLEPAAAGLPENALVQYHLGMTYVALERPEDAKVALTRALEVAGENSTLPQMEIARETLATLDGG
ncbi:tetratricopeptide repeat protein [uncultured Tateyamaria sp.]|uniref:tetratricopeptide repeat protein n=1 Tax=uncultured Tateyamaria sp. TaxID=455651 RepID=UPI002629818E|nr:tetratricopeptide repeat protein [uncultured Tateyamaria sp.]